MTFTRRQAIISAAATVAAAALPAVGMGAPAKTYFAYWMIGARVVSVTASNQAELRRLIDEADMPPGTTFTMDLS
jgi:hypothetical protein